MRLGQQIGDSPVQARLLASSYAAHERVVHVRASCQAGLGRGTRITTHIYAGLRVPVKAGFLSDIVMTMSVHGIYFQWQLKFLVAVADTVCIAAKTLTVAQHRSSV